MVCYPSKGVENMLVLLHELQTDIIQFKLANRDPIKRHSPKQIDDPDRISSMIAYNYVPSSTSSDPAEVQRSHTSAGVETHQTNAKVYDINSSDEGYYTLQKIIIAQYQVQE